MKKMMTVCAAFAALVGCAGTYWVVTNDLPTVSKDGDTIRIVTVAKDGFVETTALPAYGFGKRDAQKKVSTNLVLMKVVTTTWYEPCACPDGDPNCRVLHTRMMRERKFIGCIYDADNREGK